MDNSQGYRNPIHYTVQKACVSAVVDYLQTDQPKDKRVLVITHITFEDSTTNFTSARSFLVGAGNPKAIFEQRVGLAGVLYWWDGEIWVTPGLAFIVAFVGATVGDDIHMNIFGYEVIQQEAK
jgi:hypothetical protein